jgi:hypothetical protein
MASDYAFHRGLKFGTDFIFTTGPYSFLHSFFFSPDTYPYVVVSDLFLAALYLAPLILWGTRWSALAYVPACLGMHLTLPTADVLFAAAALSLFAICLTWRRIETALLCAPFLLAKYSFRSGCFLLGRRHMACRDRPALADFHPDGDGRSDSGLASCRPRSCVAAIGARKHTRCNDLLRPRNADPGKAARPCLAVYYGDHLL